MAAILTAAFLLLATIACLVLINNTNSFVKAGLIIITVWFGIALYFTPGHFAGFPKQIDKLPNGAWVLSYKIIEPNSRNAGGMYFWVIEDYQEDLEEFKLNPMLAFKVASSREPRSYMIPYNRKSHEQLEGAVREGKEKGLDNKSGIMVYSTNQGGKDDGENDDSEPDGKFEIINPVKLLPAKD